MEASDTGEAEKWKAKLLATALVNLRKSFPTPLTCCNHVHHKPSYKLPNLHPR